MISSGIGHVLSRKTCVVTPASVDASHNRSRQSSEKTRWQVADEVKERIQRHGGSVLGVVLNKRRHIIPGFIYKRI